MTFITGLGIVEVSADALVFFVGISAVMTSRAAEDPIVVRIRMAIRAGVIGMSSRCNWEIGMSKNALIPGGIGCSMALLAGGGIAG